MSRAQQPFRRTDVVKTLHAMKTAGVDIDTIEIGKGGEIRIRPRPFNASEQASSEAA